MFRLTREEGCFLEAVLESTSPSIRLAKEMGPGHCIVTILCDSGTRYLSKLYNPEFLELKGLSLIVK